MILKVNIHKPFFFHKKAIEAFIKSEHKEGVAVGHNNIGVSYIYMGKFDEAEENFGKCFDIYMSLEDTIGAYSAKMNLGAIEYYRGDPLAAVEIYKEVGRVMEKSGNLQSQSNCYANAGLTYTELGQLDSAEHYLFKALATDTLVGDPESVSATYRTIAQFYAAQEAFEKSRKYFETSLEMAKEINQLNTISLIYEQMSEMESAAGNHVLALDYYKLHTAYHDTLRSQNNDTELGKKAAEFEYKKQLAVKEAESAQRLKVEEEKRRKQALILYFSLGIIGVIMFFVYLLIKSLRQTRKQKALVEEAREEIAQKNEELVDSITYAKRIQTAILPPDKEVERLLPSSFILYKPKDIVAGDFYWMEEKDGKLLFAAADCTGHGVPGAMVSVICNNGLNRSVREHGITDPGKILDKTREIVIKEFEKSEEEVKDGMDIALCALEMDPSRASGSNRGKDKVTEALKVCVTLKYAGAHNPLWIIRKGGTEVEEIKADKQPIGKYAEPKPFNTHKVELNSGDTFYTFSDGFADQFGGEKGKKFKAKNFKALLLSIQN